MGPSVGKSAILLRSHRNLMDDFRRDLCAVLDSSSCFRISQTSLGVYVVIPYNPDESGLNYVPTQIISERLRYGGLDGMAYRSLLAKGGTKIVLFDFKDADGINFTLYAAEKAT
jgi:hypothetical protein